MKATKRATKLLLNYFRIQTKNQNPQEEKSKKDEKKKKKEHDRGDSQGGTETPAVTLREARRKPTLNNNSDQNGFRCAQSALDTRRKSSSNTGNKTKTHKIRAPAWACSKFLMEAAGKEKKLLEKYNRYSNKDSRAK